LCSKLQSWCLQSARWWGTSHLTLSLCCLVTESQKEIYRLLHLKYGRRKLADRRATESASTTLLPFVDLAIKLDVDERLLRQHDLKLLG
jgi:hypothetical protein